METDNSDGSMIKSVLTTFEIAETLQELDGARVTEVANHTGFAKSTVHKHLATLRHAEYVTKDGGIYRLGLKFVNHSGYVKTRKRAYVLSSSIVKEIAKETGEVVHYVDEEYGLGVVLYRETGDQAVFTENRVGTRTYLHQTAAGKAILAYLPETRVAQIIEQRGLPARTQKTHTSETDLLDDLEIIRERKVAFCDEEYTEGLRSIGVPVISRRGTVQGAFGVGGPTNRMRGERFRKDIPELMLGQANALELNIEHS